MTLIFPNPQIRSISVVREDLIVEYGTFPNSLSQKLKSGHKDKARPMRKRSILDVCDNFEAGRNAVIGP